MGAVCFECTTTCSYTDCIHIHTRTHTHPACLYQYEGWKGEKDLIMKVWTEWVKFSEDGYINCKKVKWMS